ncbi:DUF397 domain-containing protein [Streptomyces puniciscabiei]|uniref:DUF397 domain-containing protein n=1 Tax=Streptomyces puniciscabiei TaxID=164348 RepID=UPI00331A7960
MAEYQGAVAWRKSSYSNQQDQCCEMAAVPEGILVRDSKRPGDVLLLTPDAWRAAIAWVSRVGAEPAEP